MTVPYFVHGWVSIKFFSLSLQNITCYCNVILVCYISVEYIMPEWHIFSPHNVRLSLTRFQHAETMSIITYFESHNTHMFATKCWYVMMTG